MICYKCFLLTSEPVVSTSYHKINRSLQSLKLVFGVRAIFESET